MLLICYDVVALFYTFTCLFLEDPDSPSVVYMPLFGRNVDPLSAIWLWCAVIMSMWCMLHFLWVGLNAFVEDWQKIGRNYIGSLRRSKKWEERQSLVMACATCLVTAVVMWVPGMIMLLSMNMTWGITWLADSEDQFVEAHYPFYTKILRFLHGRDFMLKLQCVNLATSREMLIHVSNNTNEQQLLRVVQECEKEEFSLPQLRKAMAKGK